MHLPTKLKQEVFEQAAGCCEYCLSQVRFSTQAFSVEHIIPLSKGGSNIPSNLALACQGCNNHKYNKTQGRDPIDGAVVSLFNPRQQQWADHFNWNNDYTKIIGITSVGRATVEVLKMNRAGLINLRRVLFKMGEHPPGR